MMMWLSIKIITTPKKNNVRLIFKNSEMSNVNLKLFIPDKQVFSDLDFLGWYTTGSAPTEKHIKIHRQICQLNESPILLQLDTATKHMEVRHCNSTRCNSKVFIIFVISFRHFQFHSLNQS